MNTTATAHTAMMVDTFDLDLDLLTDEVLDHWVRCGARATHAGRSQAAATVRALLAGIAAQGLKITPGTGGTGAVNLVLLARYLYNSRPQVPAAQVPAAFGHARQDAYVLVRALACQDARVIPAP